MMKTSSRFLIALSVVILVMLVIITAAALLSAPSSVPQRGDLFDFMTPSATSPFTKTPKPTEPTETHTPTPTKRSFARMDLTLTAWPTLELIPTLPQDEAFALVSDLMENNAGCQLPCWWGITPGKTTWDEAWQLLGKLARNKGPEAHPFENLWVPGDVLMGVIIDVLYRPLGRAHDFYGGVRLSVNIDTNIISGVGTYLGDTFSQYSIGQVLEKYGRPEILLVGYYHEFDMMGTNNNEQWKNYLTLELYFPQKGIMVSYGVEFTPPPHGDLLTVCFENNPKMSLWQPGDEDYGWKEASILKPNAYVPSIEHFFKPLEEVTTLNAEDFYLQFRGMDSPVCLDMQYSALPQKPSSGE